MSVPGDSVASMTVTSWLASWTFTEIGIIGAVILVVALVWLVGRRVLRFTRRVLWSVTCVLLIPALVAAAGPVRQVLTSNSQPDTLVGPVVRVADGDTFTINAGGANQTIRLLGIDAPEIAHGATPGGCGGELAAKTLKAELPVGTVVTVTTSAISDQIDRYGRVLGYAGAGAIADLGLWMIQSGMAEAWVPAGEPYPERWHAYTAAQQLAQHAKLGAWVLCDKLGR